MRCTDHDQRRAFSFKTCLQSVRPVTIAPDQDNFADLLAAIAIARIGDELETVEICAQPGACQINKDTARVRKIIQRRFQEPKLSVRPHGCENPDMLFRAFEGVKIFAIRFCACENVPLDALRRVETMSARLGDAQHKGRQPWTIGIKTADWRP